jgi:hypothetical protein
MRNRRRGNAAQVQPALQPTGQPRISTRAGDRHCAFGFHDRALIVASRPGHTAPIAAHPPGQPAQLTQLGAAFR